MSEYQYYEFLAVDRPLSKKEMAELRAISTRAEITPTRFVNTYEWGDLKARPIDMMKKYFDAFVYLANWGTRECMFRLPLEKVDRTVKELVAAANVRREQRQRERLEQQKRENERREAERAAEREKHLKRLAAGEARAWARVDELIAQKPAKYGEAVELLKDLGEVCKRDGRDAEFRRRIRDLRESHAGKGNFIRRLDNAELGRSGV